MNDDNLSRVNFVKNIFSHKLSTVIFFVTSKCNSKCQGCFYWQNLNKNKDLTLKEIEKIIRNIGDIDHVLFSGGEPFLREDLPVICSLFRQYNHMKSVSIPTNGLLTKTIPATIEKIIMANPELQVGVHFSLDGLAKTHDQLRGVSGNFNKVVRSIKSLTRLQKKYPNIDITVNTVISNKNYQELKNLVGFVKTLKIDSHTFDLLRTATKPSADLDLPPAASLSAINNLRIYTRKYYVKDKSFWQRLFSLSKEYYLIAEQVKVLNRKKLSQPCLAGQVTAVIHHDGKIGLCEKLPVIGDLRRHNYSFKAIWLSQKVNQQREIITQHQCDCSHWCFLSLTVDHTPLTVFMRMPLNLLWQTIRH